MNAHRTVRTRATVLAAATLAVVAGLVATPVAAARTEVDHDAVTLTSAGFDFGDAGFGAGAPTGSGTLQWILQDGALHPRLTGTLHLTGVPGACARMRMDYFTGATLLARRHGGSVCAPDGRHHGYGVKLRPYGGGTITKVTVAIESQAATGDWQVVTSRTVWRNLADDDLLVTGPGIDFGGRSFAGGAPTVPGTADWSIDNATPRALVDGMVHIQNDAGGCVRVRLASYTADADGRRAAFIGDTASDPLCAPDNRHYDAPVTLSTFPFRMVEVAEVVLERLTDGRWQEVTSGEFSIGDEP